MANSLKKIMPVLCAAAAVLTACSTDKIETITETVYETTCTEYYEQLEYYAPSNAKIADGGAAYDEPFSSYTYDFSVYSNNYMITVTPDETTTGLILTVEDNQFGFSTFNVTPPANYMVCLPYSQQYASRVCTVIKGSDSVPDLLKIDFYLSTFEDESLSYTVSRFYSILDDRLVEVEVYDTIGSDASSDVLELMKYIPDSYLYQTEPLKFMPEPTVTQNDDGSLSASVITYTLNPNDMTMRRAYEDCSFDNPLYYGYAVHAIAGNVYQYFCATSLNVSDYENYVEIPVANTDSSQYFFKVDDPRFSTVAELKAYAGRFFDDAMVNEMFMTAPQQYRDIDGELYTILGDGGMDPSLGKLTITDWEIDGDVITYHTKQEQFDESYVMTGYADGGDFVVEVKDSGFTVKEYRYPSLP